MAQVATVRVKCPITSDNNTGFYVINKADINADHELFEEPQATEQTEPPIVPSWQK